MIDFPASPTLNQTYTYGGKTWEWDGTKWIAQSTLIGDHGDVTVLPDGQTWQVDAGGVSVSDLASVTGPTIIGRQTGTGALEELTPSNARSTLSLGTAAVSNVPSSGNATGTQVVIATDTRLTDSRTPTAHATSHGSGQADAISISATQVSGLSGTYAPLASPALTGTPTAPTAGATTNTTQIATTAYVMSNAAISTPSQVNASTSGTTGTSLYYARQDHAHGYPSNMVTTGTAQTITNQKTFNAALVIGSGYSLTSNSTDGTTTVAGHVATIATSTATTVVPELRLNAGYTGGEGYALLTFQRRGVVRWWVGKDNSTEGGTGTGSNFAIFRTNDAGTLLGAPLFIDRATGVTTLSPSTNAQPTITNGIVGTHLYLSTGVPESSKPGPIGSIYTDNAATNGAIGFIKKTGTGTTGWAPFYGDTGWRLISSTLANSWAGSLYLRRVNDTVMAYFDGVTQSATPTSNTFYSDGISAGFQPDKPSAGSLVKAFIPVSFASNATAASLTVTTTGFSVTPSSGTIDDTWGAITGQVSWTTSDAWPSTLPGTGA